MMIKRSTVQKWLEKRESNLVGLTSSTAFTPLSLIFMFIFVYLNVSSFSLVIIATYIDSLSYFRESIRYTLLSLLCSASQLSSPSLHHPSPAVVGRVFSRPTKSLCMSTLIHDARREGRFARNGLERNIVYVHPFLHLVFN